MEPTSPPQAAATRLTNKNLYEPGLYTNLTQVLKNVIV